MKPIFSHAVVSGTAWTAPVRVWFDSDSTDPRMGIGNAVAYCFGAELRVHRDDVPRAVCEALAEFAVKAWLDMRAAEVLEQMGAEP